MATQQENLARFQEISDRGLQDGLKPDMRSRFDALLERGTIKPPAPQQVGQVSQGAFPDVPAENLTPVDQPGPKGQALSPNPFMRFIQRGLEASQPGESVFDIPGQIGAATNRGIASGLVRAVTGMGQLAAGAGEALGVFPKGQAARVTEGGRLLEENIVGGISPGVEIPEGLSGIETAARIMAEASIGLATGSPTAGVLKMAAREAGIGAVLGGSSFIEDPEQAGISVERLVRSGGGLTLGAALPLVLGTVGKVVETLSPAAGKRVAVEDLGPEAIKLAQEAVENGILLTPSGAAKDIRLLAEEGRLRGSDTIRRQIQKQYNISNESADRIVNSFYDDLLPEGAPGAVKSQIDELYTRSYADRFNPEDWGVIHGDPSFEGMINSVLKSISGDAGLAAQFNSLPPTSIGRLDIVKKFIDGVVATKQIGDKAINLAAIPSWQALRREIVTLADNSSVVYAEARGLAQRNRIAFNLNKRLRSVELEQGANVFETTGADFYKKVLKSKGGFDALQDELMSIQNPELRKASLEKAKLIRRVIGSFAENKKVQEALIKQEQVIIQQRSRAEPAAFFSLLDWAKGTRNNQVMAFIMNPKWSRELLEPALKAKNAEQAALRFSVVLDRLAQGSMDEVRN